MGCPAPTDVSTTQYLYLGLRKEDRMILKARGPEHLFEESSTYGSEAVPMQFQQYCFLNRTQRVAILVDIPLLMGESSLGPTLKRRATSN